MAIDTSNIKKRTNNLIAYDLMKGSEEMKKIKLKYFAYIMVGISVLVGGTFTVDAVTDNSISKIVKDVFNIKVNNQDYNAKCVKMADGNLKCSVDSKDLGGNDFSFEVNKDYLDKINITAANDNIEFSIDAE